MKKVTCVLAVAALALAFAGCSKSAPGGKNGGGTALKTEGPAAALEGKYAGYGEGAAPYECEAVIAKRGDVYHVQWYFGGKPGYDGVGILKNGLFCVGYAASGGYGVVVYEVQADGTLAGVLTGAGTRGRIGGTENLTPKKGILGALGGKKGGGNPGPAAEPGAVMPVGALAGEYVGAGFSPDLSSYLCDVGLTLGQDVAVYNVVWTFDGRPGYEGTGILMGKTFAAGFADRQGYGVVAYTVNADGSLDGTRTGKGATRTGTEKLKRE